MITEDHLEQLALTWFQVTGWTYLPGQDIAPEAVASDRAEYRAVVLKASLAAVGWLHVHPLTSEKQANG